MFRKVSALNSSVAQGRVKAIEPSKGAREDKSAFLPGPTHDRVHVHQIFVAPRQVFKSEPADAAVRARRAMRDAITIVAGRMAKVPAAVDGHLWTDLPQDQLNELVADIAIPSKLTVHRAADFTNLIGQVENLELRGMLNSNLNHPLCANVGILADNMKMAVGILYSDQNRSLDANLDRRFRPDHWLKRIAVGSGLMSWDRLNYRAPDEANLVLDIDTTQALSNTALVDESIPVRIPKLILSAGASCVPGNISFRAVIPGHPKNLAALRMNHAAMDTGDYRLSPAFASKRDLKLQEARKSDLKRATNLFFGMLGQNLPIDHASRIRYFETAERINRQREWFEEKHRQAKLEKRPNDVRAAELLFNHSCHFILTMAMNQAVIHELGMDGATVKQINLVRKIEKLPMRIFNKSVPFVEGSTWLASPIPWSPPTLSIDLDKATLTNSITSLLQTFNLEFPGVSSEDDATF